MKRIIILAFTLIISALSYAQGGIEFSADFPAGSLGTVTQINDSLFVIDRQRDPENPVDSTLQADANWYFFRITGIKDRKIELKVEANDLTGTSFSYDGLNWHHFSLEESGDGFLSFRSPKDSIYIATFVPYTFQHHLDRIAEWQKHESVRIDTIGYSVEGRPLQLMHISGKSSVDRPGKRVWIHGRVHPSETPGSYLLDGLMDKLLDDSPESVQLRDAAEFFILPFANPDGVADALSRSNAEGINLEINYFRPDDSTAVEVKAIKSTLERLTAQQPFDIALNNHSQLSGEATFWIHTAESTSQAFFISEMTFANLCCIYSPYMTVQDLAFSNVGSRYAEGWFWDHFRERTLALTLETPHSHYSSGEWVTTDNLKLFGQQVLQAIATYIYICLK